MTGLREQRQRPQLISTTFLEHLLAIGQTRLIALETTRLMIQAEVAAQPEPMCWRPYVGPHGQRLTIRPDLHLETTTDTYRDSYFVEVDRATENPARVIAKCHQYVQYRRTGIEQSKTNGSFPAVLWIVPSMKRKDQLARYLKEAELPKGMFFVLTLDEFPQYVRDGPPTGADI